MSITTGKTDSSLGPIYHKTLAEAEAWIAERAKTDPEGAERGDYYLDAPEELLVRERLLHEPSLSNEEYGRIVEEAAQADDARALEAEREDREREQIAEAEAAPSSGTRFRVEGPVSTAQALYPVTGTSRRASSASASRSGRLTESRRH